ncbi:hypothetical protein I5H32_gp071 [Mycobacterium phage EleanorGeorge]|uniref:DUF7414 domain-containing protein n=1 Tax=Mycobacterium phage EleanorGeorge TaxID=2301563 RepID=A0A385DN32_9CAUD|nr:hypothetical protein I5H32_gp071 [Mycobacterium phage EleanorGeorge]AXQ60771.1 hypothetical protein SEA_ELEANORGEORGE_71 [Mycobacterium phage EleanorGeorge]
MMYTVSGTWPHYIITGGPQPVTFECPIKAMKYLASAVLKPGDNIHWQVP